MNSDPSYDAVLVVSFGGPEGPDDVLPFLENVLRGKNVPRQRMLEVAEHYHHFGGVSPINAQNRALIAHLVDELRLHGCSLPVYWGNRNWHPLLPDTLAQMRDDGIRRSLAFFTSAFSSYSGCRQYRENIAEAQSVVGDGAPAVDKLRVFYNHPGFLEPLVEGIAIAEKKLVDQCGAGSPLYLFSAHSIPLAMARNCSYEGQLHEAMRLAMELLGRPRESARLVYQSRSGPPSQPWLEPDVGQALREIAQSSPKQGVVLVPLGFVSDHMEVMYDLDSEACSLAQELGLPVVRSASVGTHPRFVRMIRELIEERLDPSKPKLALGDRGPSHDVCPADCCLASPSHGPARGA